MTDLVMSNQARRIMEQKYLWKDRGETELADIANRVATNVVNPYAGAYWASKVEQYIREGKMLPGGRYLYAAGRPLHQVNNCMLFRIDDSREGWAELSWKQEMALMTGAGTGTVYSDLRAKGTPISKTGGVASGPVAKMMMINEIGRHVMQGGSRRSAIWAGLHWDHPDIFEFMTAKDWPDYIKQAKEQDFNAYAPLDMTNISVILDTRFRNAFEDSTDPLHDRAHEVFDFALDRARTTGEPGFSIDIDENEGENLRNACTEIVSRDDSDICNLGSVNWGAIDTIEEFREVLEALTILLMCGTIYTDLPFPEVRSVLAANRRIGVGVMGFAEWAAKRGLPYGPSEELTRWANEYQRITDMTADEWATRLGINRPIAVRAIAPAGTISIVAGTTSGIEPVFAVGYKRRNIVNGEEWQASYEVDKAAQRLIDQGVDPDSIPTALELAENIEPVLQVMAEFARVVDQSISKTVNLPSVERQTELGITTESLKAVVGKYIFKLRGLTFYPDGARGGQPLTPVPYAEAVERGDTVFTEIGNEVACSLDGVCG